MGKRPGSKRSKTPREKEQEVFLDIMIVILIIVGIRILTAKY